MTFSEHVGGHFITLQNPLRLQDLKYRHKLVEK